MPPARLLRAAVFVLAIAVASASLAILGEHTNARFDLTATGRHRLDARTLARLDALDQPVEILVAVARSGLDPRARDRVDDVLGALAHASGRIRVTTIDTASPRGPAQYAELIERLEAREAPARARRALALEAIAGEANTLAGALGAMDAAAASSARADEAHAPRLLEFAAFARVAARQATEHAGTIEGPPGVRALAGFAGQLEPQLSAMARELGSMTTADTEARLRLREASRLAEDLRARAAVLARAEARLGVMDLDRVAGALESGEAVLLIAPPRPEAPGLVAIDTRELFPPPEVYALAGVGAEAETSARAEQFILSALSILTDPARPIVVFVHGEPRRWIDQAGVLDGLLERLARAGIDHAEWAAVIEPDPPAPDALDPTGQRPVVYCFISPNSAAGAEPDNPQGRPGTERALRVGTVLGELVARGESVLVGLNPSVFPTFGDADPILGALAPLGVRGEPGRPVLTAIATATARAASPSHRVVPAPSEHPVGASIAGLPVALEWPVPLEPGPGGTPLLTIPASTDVWGETQWLRLWRTPRNQRSLLLDQPDFNEAQGDTRGPFTVAVAARSPAGGRAVVVGSNTWFLDHAWRAQQLVDGQPMLVNPGNVELFDAAVLWLAGREELIAPGPTARPVPRIRPISEGTLGVIRWSLIAGLPLGILLLGGIVRLARR
jgi:hypothetical protein